MIKNFIYWIYDKLTFKQLPFLQQFIDLENLSIQDLKQYQLNYLKDTAQKFNISINSWEDFYRLPITTKQDLPESPNQPEQSIHTHETSGSTGQPRVIWVPAESWYRKDAIFSRSWLRMGRKNQWVFRLISGQPKYPLYDWFRNVKAMNYKTIGQAHIDWVIKHKPFLIHGPGGAIRQLCEQIIEQGHGQVLKDIKIHWCSESSSGHKERLEPLVKEFCEQYGLAELPTVGATDGEGNIRVVMEQGIIEILDDNNLPAPEGQEGYIVVTDYKNYQTPIFRYRCGDRGKMKLYTNKQGRSYYILYDIIGRGVDYYNGPEVKKAIGWWVVAPISHILGNTIEKWRCEIKPKEKLLILYVKFKESHDFEALKPYAQWVEDNVGLQTQFVIAQEESYDIYWKNKLVKVTE